VDKVVKDSEGRTTPLAFLVDAAGVCPKCFVTPFALDAMTARAWWEKGQLGMTYDSAPSWVPDTFGILNFEIDKALALKREIARNERTTQQSARQGTR